MIMVKIMNIFSYNQNCERHKMAEIEDEVCHLVAEAAIIRWQHLILFYFIFIYMVKL